ncbi:MAG: hypothetical protein FWG83_03200 [Oscillospiraceae bacterium]|nr:hypothetical protein [Oscillospiraceae bacterium]
MDGSFNWLNYIDVFHQRCSKYIVPSGSFGYSGSYSYGSYGFGSYVFGSYGFGSYGFGSYGFGSYGLQSFGNVFFPF